jgi:putative transposase
MALPQSAVSDLLEVLRTGDAVDLIRESVRTVLQELIEAEAAEVIGAARYERRESRVNERNGSRPRTLSTKAGDIDLRIPKLRKGSFFPLILEPRRRIDQALYAVVMEAYVAGVSTRSVDDLVAALGIDSGISKSEVSRICAGLDEVVTAFRTAGWTTPPSPTATWTRPTCTYATPPPRSCPWPWSWPPGSPPTAAAKSSAWTPGTARTRCSGAASSPPSSAAA